MSDNKKSEGNTGFTALSNKNPAENKNGTVSLLLSLCSDRKFRFKQSISHEPAGCDIFSYEAYRKPEMAPLFFPFLNPLTSSENSSILNGHSTYYHTDLSKIYH